MDNRHILFLSYDGLTDPLGQSQILPYLTGLSEAGYSIVIVSFEKPEKFKQRSSVIAHYCHQKNLKWEPLIYHKWPPVFSTLYDVFLLNRKAKALHSEKQFAVVHCRSYITALVGLTMRRKFSIRFIFDMRGFWADERVEGGLWNIRNPFYRMVYGYFKRMEKIFLKEADYIISLTYNAKTEIENWGIKTPIAVIPTCVDLHLFDRALITDAQKQALRTELGITKNDFVLLYVGSWGTWYLTEQMLAFFEKLQKQIPTAKFLVITQDKIDLDKDRYFGNVIIRSVYREFIPLHISIASGAIFFIKTSFSKKASSATKMGEIMALGIPLVTNAGWGDIGLFEGQGVNLLPDFSEQSMERGISALIEDQADSLSDQQHKNLESLSLEKGVSNYKRVYSELIP